MAIVDVSRWVTFMEDLVNISGGPACIAGLRSRSGAIAAGDVNIGRWKRLGGSSRTAR